MKKKYANVDISPTYGDWTVLSAPVTRWSLARLPCRCSCGTERTVSLYALINGRSHSCGCGHHRALLNSVTHHGQCRVGQKTRTYRAWQAMRTRCDNPQGKDKLWYKGVTYCERWRSFENFYADMGDATEGMTIDRIDSSGDYSPENCKWSTAKQQANNRSNNVIITHNGESLTVTQWAERMGVRPQTLFSRINLGWAPADVVSTPLRNRWSRQRKNKMAALNK